MSSIVWKERNDKYWIQRPPVHPPLEDFLIRVVIKHGKVHKKRGELYFIPGQSHVPIVIMDSMGQNLEQPPHAIYIIWHGGVIESLVEWVKTNILDLKARLPLSPNVIMAGGGNSISSRLIKPYRSGHQLAENLINRLEELSNWCEVYAIILTVGSVLPRPSDQDEHKSKLFHIPLWKRKQLSAAYVGVNKFIKALNKRNGVKQLPLHRFVSFCDGENDESNPSKRSKSKQRLYPDTEQCRIHLACFSPFDWVHLSPKGDQKVGDVLCKHISPKN